MVVSSQIVVMAQIRNAVNVTVCIYGPDVRTGEAAVSREIQEEDCQDTEGGKLR